MMEASGVQAAECHELIQGVKGIVCSVENRVEGAVVAVKGVRSGKHLSRI